MRRILAIPWRLVRWLLRWLVRLAVVVVIFVAALRWIDPPLTFLMASERARLGGIAHEWVDLSALPAHVADAAVAAEDANFCRHRGFDIEAIRAAWADGANRGASTISQQTAKNVFLWPERSWLRKGLEAGFAGLIELLWGKRRIIEVYLNVAEFGEGVFGIGAASRAAFDVPAAELSQGRAARLMTVLPAPRDRSAVSLSATQAARLKTIEAGAATIGRDDRGACYRDAPRP